MFVPHGCNADLAATVKKYTSLPVGVVGGINSPELAEEILAQGKADYIILGRQMIADPDFPQKAMSGRADEIRRCVRCFTCFPGSPEEGYADIPWPSSELALRVGSCTVNPRANLPFDYTTAPRPETPKRILVIGGGPAGMQAAITCADQGHDVTLVEKESALGGLLRFADVDVDKRDLREFKDLLAREVSRRPIAVLTNTPASASLFERLAPESVILAVGSHPATPPIPGLERAHQALDLYLHGLIPGARVVMVGGGLVGCEAGLHLAKTDHAVTVIELLDRLANDAFGMYREALMLEMEKCGIEYHVKARCLEITEKGVRVAMADGGERSFPADTVIYALGMKSNPTEELERLAGGVPVFKVGDCVRPAKVDSAVREGYLAAMAIL